MDGKVLRSHYPFCIEIIKLQSVNIGKKSEKKRACGVLSEQAPMDSQNLDRNSRKYKTMSSVKEFAKNLLRRSYRRTKSEKEGRFDGKTPKKVIHVLRDVADDKERCTPQSSGNQKDVQDDTISEADKAWLESLELTENPAKFEEPPDEFAELLTR